MYTLVKSQAMKYVQAEIIRRTIFAALMTSLAPIAFLKVGKIIGTHCPYQALNFLSHF